jgi:hypothetical protein
LIQVPALIGRPSVTTLRDRFPVHCYCEYALPPAANACARQR